MQTAEQMQTETARLLLRAWQPSDAETLIRLAGQAHIEYWMPDWREYDKHAKGWIEWVLDNYEKNDPMEAFISWAITLKESGALIGQIAIGCFDEAGEKELGVGYWMSLEHNGQGYMTEALRAVVRVAFDTYGYGHVVATVQPHNHASRRVVEKAGFQYIKIIEFQDNDQPTALPFCYYRLDNSKEAPC